LISGSELKARPVRALGNVIGGLLSRGLALAPPDRLLRGSQGQLHDLLGHDETRDLLLGRAPTLLVGKSLLLC